MTLPSRMLLKEKTAGLLLVMVFITAVLAWTFGPVLLDPNQYYLSAGGDGIRNYYTVAYYVKYDSGLHFSGMNYPFGEHVLYTDNQFPIAFCMRQVQAWLFDVSAYTVGIINYVMFISLLLSAVFLYLLLFHLKVKNWFAIPAAVAIAVISPQLQRMIGHYSLGYVFFMPLILYLLAHFQQSWRKLRWMLLFASIIFLFALTHLYYLPMAGAFLLSYVLAMLSMEYFSSKKVSFQFVWLVLSILLPFILIQGFLFITDPVTDRIKIPYGFFQSYATSESVFNPPAWSYWRNAGFGQLISHTSQGYAYIGLVADITIVLSLMLFILYFFQIRVFQKIISSLPVFPLVAVLASIPVLLFSMCLPWRWNMQELLNNLTMIRQFRALDRFAYVFYYVISVFTAVVLYAFISAILQHGIRAVAWIITAVVFLFWLADGYSNLKALKDAYPSNNYAREYFSSDNFAGWLAEEGFSPHDFQAIFPLPFYHLGSEKIWIDHPISMYVSSWASLNTGLPITASYLGRTSVEQTSKLVQLTSDSLMEKELLKSFSDDRPFLVVTSGEECTPYEKYLLTNATFINKRGPYSMYLLPLSVFKTSYTQVRNVFANKEQLIVSQDKKYYTSRFDTSVVMSDITSGQFFTGDAVVSADGPVELFNNKLKASSDSVMYDVSVWVKLFLNSYASPDMHVFQLNDKGDTISNQYVQAKSSANISNGWARMNLSFMLLERNSRVHITLTCEDSIAASRLMIRPLQTDVYYACGNDGSFVVNNFLVKAP